MQSVDILYLAYNRLKFTEITWCTMLQTTDWSRVDRLFVYDDGSTDGTAEFLEAAVRDCPKAEFRRTRLGGPVAVTNHFLSTTEGEAFVKVDSDTMLPPGWLNECLGVMEANPNLDLLGIEALYAVGPAPRKVVPAVFIGGIGVMRRRCFTTLPVANGRFGFTAWQDQNEQVKKAWLDPALPVCLLDRLPMEPFKSLSEQYVANGWQRPWPGPYDPVKDAEKWSWFC